MNASDSTALDEPGSAAEHYTYDLNPLREGPDSLDTHDLPEFKAIHLCELDLAWEDPYHQTTTIRGDSLFDSPAAKSDPAGLIPPCAILTGAAFEILSNDDKKCTFEIHPPNGFKITRSSFAHLVHLWMLKHHFQAIAAAFYALLGLVLPFPLLPDHETGERNTERHSRCQP